MFHTWQRSSDLVVVANRNLINSFRVKGEWSSGGWEDWTMQINMTIYIYNRHKKTHDGTRPIQSVSCALIKHLYESLQLFGELFDTEESSLFQHAYRGDDCQNNVWGWFCCTHPWRFLSHPEGWSLRWWSADRVSDNSEWVQSNLDSGRSDKPPESPACSPKHLS